MIDTRTPSMIHRVYVAALAVHGGVLIGLIALAVASVRGMGADSAPDTAVFAALHALPVLLTGLPSAVALLSWYLCRRQGVAPSTGHIGLAVAAAAVLLIVLAVGIAP